MQEYANPWLLLAGVTASNGLKVFAWSWLIQTVPLIRPAALGCENSRALLCASAARNEPMQLVSPRSSRSTPSGSQVCPPS